MSLIARRAVRWWTRTLWMARAVAADFGLNTETRGRRGASPLWLRENPFLARTMRSETRRFSFFWRFVIMLLLTGAALVGVLTLNQEFPAFMRVLAANVFGASAPTLAAAAVITVQTVLITATRTALSPSLATEARRQTLDGLLVTPVRPAEMILAMTIGPLRGSLLMGLAALPLYVLIQQLGGMEWTEIFQLALFFAIISLKPPAYVLPGLGGAVSTLKQQRNLRQAQARQQRQDQGTDRTSMTIIAVVMFGFFVQIFSRMFGGGWILHLLRPLESALPHAQFVLAGVFFSWPYFAVKLMDATLPFYHGSLPTLVYLLPLLALTRIAGVLRSGAALTVGEASEISRAPIARRAAAISRWTQRLTIILLAGYAWNVCVTSGDTASLLGRGTGGGWDQAGLLLLLGFPALINAAWRAVNMGVRVKGQPLRRRPMQLIRQLLRQTGRPLRTALAMFVVVCLLGGVSPVAAPVLQTLAALAITAAVTFCYSLGINVLLAAPISGARRRWIRATLALLFFSPIAAIFIPLPAFWHLGAASPLLAWIHLFPAAEAELARSTVSSDMIGHWPYGTAVPVAEYLAAPVVLSMICLWLGYRLSEAGIARDEPAATREPKQKTGIRAASPRPMGAQTPSGHKKVAYGDRTEALMGWICAWIDNPLFIRELRSRTRSGAWYQWVFIVPALFVLLEVATALYPDLAMGFAEGLSWVRFFHIRTPNWPLVTPETYASVAGVILTLQVCALGLRMPAQCEEIFRRDRQTGGLGFILLTPLRSAQIFWGLIWANVAASVVAWTAFAAVLLALYLQAAASPEVGLGPALTAWVVGQIFMATMLAMGAAIGSAMATHTTALRTGRGISTLLALGVIGIAASLIFTNYQEFFEAISPLWVQTTWRMMFGVAAALPVTVLAFFYAQWRLKRLRDGDIAFGENIPS